MIKNLSLVFSIFLIAGILIPAYAQTSPDHVVINEVDINPFGDDSASITEWIELYNPTDSNIDLGGWEIASTTVFKKTLTIPDGTIIGPGQFLKYQYQSLWFADSAESVELRDNDGAVIDKTPTLTDTANDFTSWQRLYDGYDLDSSDDWKFAISTAGASNGRLIEIEESKEVTITVSSEESYLFGEVAVIEGSVSEEVLVVKPHFKPEPIIIDIDGPDFYKTITLYPDLNLNYDVTLNLNQVLGVNAGTYDVSVSYAGATASTSFSVGLESIKQEEQLDGSLGILTDNSQYLPGQTVLISGTTSEITPFVGMKFTIVNARGEEIVNGHLFPTNNKFETSIFITTVNPSYGTHEINAEYSGESASTTFEVVEDIKEDVPISLSIDKEAYGLGDKVIVTGRLNQVWVGVLDLEITQTKQTGLGGASSGSDAGFKILDAVNVMGDGTFTYTFTIPENSLRLGDYRINVSKDIGSVTIIAHVVDDPENFIRSSEPLTINTDKQVYDLGDTMILDGFILNPYTSSSYKTGSSVKITISNQDGSPLGISSLPKEEQTPASGGSGYEFTAIPETSGRYSTQIDIIQNIFTAGNYTVKSQYAANTATNTFSIINSLDLKDGAIISLDKQVYGLGETVTLSGILPPTGEKGIEISLTKPDGTTINSGAILENQRLSWSWVTPSAEKPQNIKTDDGRNTIKSNFGIYKIKLSVSPESMNFFFKVSADPENDSISQAPIFVSTDKSIYQAGEKLKVSGNVILRDQGDEGLIIPDRVRIVIVDKNIPFKPIYESSVYPNQGGAFSSLFELPATIFSEGFYTVKASYTSGKSNVEFSVANDFVFGLDDDLALLLSTDQSEYYPGDVVEITGKPNKLVYVEIFKVSVIKKAETEITCGSFICGTNTGPVTSIHPSPSGSFNHQFVIPDSISSIGTYEVAVDANFEKKSIQFNVIEKPQSIKLDTVIEKENRISEDTITISTEEKISDGATISPRVISGSLITPLRDDESNVNLKVSSTTGTCIIGPDVDCLVSESTRKPGQIYDIVEVDGISLNVRYSGPDVRLEKFSISPESSSEFLPNSDWNVKVLKDDQVSRFYYKITYKVLE